MIKISDLIEKKYNKRFSQDDITMYYKEYDNEYKIYFNIYKTTPVFVMMIPNEPNCGDLELELDKNHTLKEIEEMCKNHFVKNVLKGVV